MADDAMMRKGMNAWAASLDRMQKNLADMLGQTSTLPVPPPIEAEQAARVSLSQLDQRLADWDSCLEGAERDVQIAEVSTREEIAELQTWTLKMAEAREKLANVVSRAGEKTG